MIIDLNLKGKQVIIVGGGAEAARKVESLLTQDCEIIVLAERVTGEIDQRAKQGKITLKKTCVTGGEFLKEYDRVILVMAVTDDRGLNRKIIEEAKIHRCYVYSTDDPEASDFGHPAVINLFDTVQVAISTGGKSPLMAQVLRKRAEPVLKALVNKGDILQIRLQNTVRKEAQKLLETPEDRKRFLEKLMEDEKIMDLLKHDKFEEAQTQAMAQLKDFCSPN